MNKPLRIPFAVCDLRHGDRMDAVQGEIDKMANFLQSGFICTLCMNMVLLAGCGGGGGTSTVTTPQAATPTISPAPGSYTSAQTVTIADTTAGAAIYYTTNGTTPTTASTKYTATITVSATETIEAIAVASGYSDSAIATAAYTITSTAATPTISTSTTTGAQNGAVVASISALPGATIYYTLDGSTPTTSSQVYEAPFLVASNLTVNAIAVLSGDTDSSVATQTFTPDIASGTLVWSDEFANSTSANAAPNSSVWTYDTGNSGWGNSELENYCAYGSTTSPCSSSTPNAFVAPGGGLNIVAEEPSTGVYTSARMKTEGQFSFQYGRIEVKASVPEAQGFWPAFWLLGNNINTVSWPACGEMDVLERIDAAGTPDWNAGSIHGTGFTGSNLGADYDFPTGQTAATPHTYGMIWSKGSVAYYIDDPAKPYATFTPSSISSFSGSVWPFDAGPNFIIINLAIGGGWPGSPNSSTPFPSTMQVDYVRIYAN
jgi:beta-glucanase (GH16 family)